MNVNIPSLLEGMMKAIKGKQVALAERLSEPGRDGLKVTQPQISRWMNGQVPELPNFERIIAVARELDVIPDLRSEDVAASLPQAVQPPRIKLKGYVGAGDEAHYYKLSDDAFEEVSAPMGYNDRTVALQIRGKSLGPLLDTWIVYYDDVRSPVTPDLHGEVCVVGLSDDRILVKKLKAEPGGTFTLLSNGVEPEIRNAHVEWAAKVTDMKPR